MRLRLPRWLRPEPVPQGRHVRRPAPVTAPSAAAALVVGAAEPYLVAPTALDDPVPAPDAALEAPAELPPPEPEPVTAGDQIAAPVEAAAVEALEAPAGPAAPVLDAAPAAEPTVARGFADGGVLELAADDPRLAGFQDAAAAVLGRPEA